LSAKWQPLNEGETKTKQKEELWPLLGLYYRAGRREADFEQLLHERNLAVEVIPPEYLHEEYQDGQYRLLRVCKIDADEDMPDAEVSHPVDVAFPAADVAPAGSDVAAPPADVAGGRADVEDAPATPLPHEGTHGSARTTCDTEAALQCSKTGKVR
jgi:hypothetical protein